MGKMKSSSYLAGSCAECICTIAVITVHCYAGTSKSVEVWVVGCRHPAVAPLCTSLTSLSVHRTNRTTVDEGLPPCHSAINKLSMLHNSIQLCMHHLLIPKSSFVFT